jgi:hypothetical protein
MRIEYQFGALFIFDIYSINCMINFKQEYTGTPESIRTPISFRISQFIQQKQEINISFFAIG